MQELNLKAKFDINYFKNTKSHQRSEKFNKGQFANLVNFAYI